MSQDTPSPDNTALVRIATGPLVGPVLGRVVGMLAARAECPVDRLDEALLVVDTLAAHGPTYVLDGHLTVRVSTASEKLELRVGPLKADGAQSLLNAATVPGVGNVLERMADEVTVADDVAAGDVLVIAMGFSA